MKYLELKEVEESLAAFKLEKVKADLAFKLFDVSEFIEQSKKKFNEVIEDYKLNDEEMSIVESIRGGGSHLDFDEDIIKTISDKNKSQVEIQNSEIDGIPIPEIAKDLISDDFPYSCLSGLRHFIK